MERWFSWLLALVAVVLLAAVLWAVLRRPGPERGDIWWAEVPFADGTGAKLRPCLVLLNRRRGITVLPITSQDKSRRGDYLSIPTRSWDPRAKHDSYLNLREPVLVRHAAFQRRAGPCDETTLRLLHTRSDLRPSALRAVRS